MSFENNWIKPVAPSKPEVNSEIKEEENRVDILELEHQRQIDTTEVNQEIKIVRELITDLANQNKKEEANLNLNNQTSGDKKDSSWFNKIKDNKWLKRIALASAIGTSVLNPIELNAQTEKEALSKNKIELSAEDSATNTALEQEKAEKLEFFSSAINKMIVYNDLYPNSNFLEAWNPGDGVAYFNKNMKVGHLEDYDSKKWKDIKEYDVDIVKNGEGKLVNFVFIQRNKDVVTSVGYNGVLGRELSALRYSYREQLGFKKMTAREFEGICSGLLIVTEPGYREDMNNNYVWVDDKLDEQKIIDNVLTDFNREDAFPELEKK